MLIFDICMHLDECLIHVVHRMDPDSLHGTVGLGEESYIRNFLVDVSAEDLQQQVNLDGNPKNCSSDGSGSFDSDVKSRISSHSDFFVGHSTVPGFKSYRLQHGSFFINMILLVFQKYSHSDDLLSMMTCVNRSVQERLDAFNEKFVSISSQRHTLTRKFYFPVSYFVILCFNY